MVLRRLCGALAKESLPLHNDLVQILLRQSLFQVGDLEIKNGEVQLCCRKDFDDIRTTCTFLLNDLCDAYAGKTSACEALLILSEMVCYFGSTFTTDKIQHELEIDLLREVAKKLAIKAMELGQEKDNEIPKVEPKFVSSFRSKQVIFFRIAILCVVHYQDFSLEEVRIISKCVVRARNACVEDDGDSHERDWLRASCDYFLSNRQSSYLLAIKTDPEILSEALRAVVATAPCALHWVQDQNSEASFAARGNDGHWYSINTLSGIVLVNGLPPNQLPASIANDERYQRIFGYNNFEVISKSGEFETLHPVEGCFYRFHKTDDTLVIRESRRFDDDMKDGSSDIWDDCLELLDRRSIETWGTDLPKRLKESYSH
jgi:hypothetical protein